ncbi:MAG: diguanylate cyclase [Phycisphaerae bacterium]|nr:diguanylate cyclase [Phycisphaerae bacterium]
MSVQTDDLVQKRLRLGAIGSLGAVTLLWLAHLQPLLFPVGTALLTMSLVPLACGFRGTGGGLLGLLFGVLWVAAKLGVSGEAGLEYVLNPANGVAVGVMILVGVLGGVFFGLPYVGADRQSGVSGDAARVVSARQGAPEDGMNDSQEPEDVRRSLTSYREWMIGWNRQTDPWSSFDNFVRERLRGLVGARRIRCYRVESEDQLRPLNKGDSEAPTGIGQDDGLLRHVLSSGERYVASSPKTGALIRELAEGSASSPAWVIPIQCTGRACGIVTVGGFEKERVDEGQLDLAADLVEEFWLHLRRADELRLAQLLDKPSGVLNRVQVLALLDQTIERCCGDNEPVVMLAVVVEGIRKMDDGGMWDKRNDVIETIGQTMRKRLRHDDMVGRFSDDRFVALLRRMDIPLAYLITRKILESAEAELGRLVPGIPLTLRAGLAGSGLEQTSSQTLLLKAFSDISEARSQGLTVLGYTKRAEVLS